MKYIKIYENFEDFEEIWEEEKDLEVDLTGVNLGNRGPKFDLLDKVIVVNNNIIKDYKHNLLKNKVGYVIDHEGAYYLIYFVNKISGHDGNRSKHNIPNHQGWWLFSGFIKKID